MRKWTVNVETLDNFRGQHFASYNIIVCTLQFRVVYVYSAALSVLYTNTMYIDTQFFFFSSRECYTLLSYYHFSTLSLE